MFPAELRTFVDEETWTFARTMPEWPHEYLVRDHVDEELFVRLVEHIRAHGCDFLPEVITYYEEGPWWRAYDHRHQQVQERRHLRRASEAWRASGVEGESAT